MISVQNRDRLLLDFARTLVEGGGGMCVRGGGGKREKRERVCERECERESVVAISYPIQYNL